MVPSIASSLFLALLCLSSFGNGAPREGTPAYCKLPQRTSESSPLVHFYDHKLPIRSSFLEIENGGHFYATCDNGFEKFPTVTALNFECVSANVVKTAYGIQSFSDITCKGTLDGEIVKRTGICYNNYTEVEIAFENASPPYTLITVCHNEELDETLYSKHYIFGAELPGESSGNRPSFKEADFYPHISTDDCYKQVTQIETVATLVGSQSLANQYIQTGSNLFFSRGHLTPNGDPIKTTQKHATFYFINASPQWQTINGGNWNQLEIKLRTLAQTRRSTFTVWTGSYGVMELDDVNDNPVEIWLGRNSTGGLVKKLPVNKYTWKVVFDEEMNQAVAVIMINNPWHGEVTNDDIFCPNVCNGLSWVSWNTQDMRLGYTFCCDVESFLAAVPYAPTLNKFVTLLN